MTQQRRRRQSTNPRSQLIANETLASWRVPSNFNMEPVHAGVCSASAAADAQLLPQLLSPEDVANYLGVSAYTVRARLKRGEIPGRKHGARWLIRVADLTAYVEPNNYGTGDSGAIDNFENESVTGRR